jgi:hypothetical protein
MRSKAFAMTALGLCAFAVPASAQIIATSIPRAEAAGTGKGVTIEENKWALHLMASPFAKWKINSYTELPQGSDAPVFVQATSTDSSSKFIGAAELAFKAGSDFTVGLGGWFNTLGTADVETFELDGPNGIGFAGTATAKMRVSEFHGSLFYRDVGVQAGVVKTTSTLKGFRQGSVVFDLITLQPIVVFQRDATLAEANIPEEDVSTTSWDAFLVYKKGSESETKNPWGLSVGAGMFRDNEAKSTAFSGFITGSVQLYKGLGIDASFWYVGGKKQTITQEALADDLDTALPSNLSRFTIGIGYSFPN